MERNKNPKPIIQPDDIPQNIKDHVDDISFKVARKAIESLTPELLANLNHNESILWLVRLLTVRLYNEVHRYILALEIIKQLFEKKPSLKDAQFSRFVDYFDEAVQTWTEKPIGADTPLVRRVYIIFLRQLKEYRKKYKEDMSQTILKAIKKDTRSICRLLEWDKTWIEFSFVHNEISARGNLYDIDSDKRFLDMVGDAIRKKPHVKQESTKYFEYFHIISGLLANRVSLPADNYRALKEIHSYLVKTGAFDSGTEEEGNPLADFKYFTRFLKRHNVL